MMKFVLEMVFLVLGEGCLELRELGSVRAGK